MGKGPREEKRDGWYVVIAKRSLVFRIAPIPTRRWVLWQKLELKAKAVTSFSFWDMGMMVICEGMVEFVGCHRVWVGRSIHTQELGQLHIPLYFMTHTCDRLKDCQLRQLRWGPHRHRALLHCPVTGDCVGLSRAGSELAGGHGA